ncbi:MAG: hypothetical protein KDB07_13600, partial [Planctomycetes bacterium]|nr:hypothetical protein [Planctomycetota bacterium]
MKYLMHTILAVALGVLFVVAERPLDAQEKPAENEAKAEKDRISPGSKFRDWPEREFGFSEKEYAATLTKMLAQTDFSSLKNLKPKVESMLEVSDFLDIEPEESDLARYEKALEAAKYFPPSRGEHRGTRIRKVSL